MREKRLLTTYPSQMLNKISIRQAQLAFDQTERSREMAILARLDTRATLEQGRRMQSLTILASLFLPISTLAVSITLT
jgi:hypothetical protein